MNASSRDGSRRRQTHRRAERTSSPAARSRRENPRAGARRDGAPSAASGAAVTKEYPLKGETVYVELSEGSGGRITSSTLRTHLSEIFLPRAYHLGDLAPEYLRFQTLDTLQGLSSYLRGVLTTREMLIGFGVGDETADASSATLHMVLRDGVGMAAGLWLAWFGARSFGSKVKAWRLFADVANDVALTLDLLAPGFASGMGFTVLVCLSQSLKAWCGVASGATRAVLTQHFARNAEDVADVQAKEGSQETAVTLIGMLLGYLYIFATPRVALVDRCMFAVLTLAHVLANHAAVRCIAFRTLDAERLDLQSHEWMANATTLSFSQVAERERLVRFADVAAGLWPRKRDAEAKSTRLVSILLRSGVALSSDLRALYIDRRAASPKDILACLAFARWTTKNELSSGARALAEFDDLVERLEGEGWDLMGSLTLLMNDRARCPESVLVLDATIYAKSGIDS